MKYTPWALTAALVCSLTGFAQEPGRPNPYGGRMNIDGARTYSEGGRTVVEPGQAPPQYSDQYPNRYPDRMPDRVVIEPGKGPDGAPVPLDQAGLRFAWDQEPVNSPFRAGSMVGYGYLSGDFGVFSDDATLWGGHVGVGYYYRDNVSFNIEAMGLYGSRLYRRLEDLPPVITPTGVLPGQFSGVPTGNEAPFFGLATQALVRCHVLNYGTWSLYGDWGLGFAYLTKSVPADGTNYNFILTAGVGFTKQLDACTHLIGGCRWFHFSNGAFFTDVNPGYDSKMIYLGVLQVF